MMISKRKVKKTFLITITSIICVYILISVYFFNHYFFHTEINGVNVSLLSHDKLSINLDQFVKDYNLQLLERGGDSEVITSHDISMHLNKNFNLSKLNSLQNPFLWVFSLFHDSRYHFNNMYVYSNDLLIDKISRLHCINQKVTEPRNVSFQYNNGDYVMIKEEYGNKIDLKHFIYMIHRHLSNGDQKLDLNVMHCYVDPKYTLKSQKATIAHDLLNKYTATRVTYRFGSLNEILDGTTIHTWLTVDDNLNVLINKMAIEDYITSLSKKYDTVGITREFQTSIGNKVEVKGGLYGWKIDIHAESKALLKHIKHGDVMEKEPLYLQKALTREGNEIGNTYIEINITKQQLWYYKNGKLLVQSAVVTGNPNNGNATVLGVYMLNYKQLNTTLEGPGYEAKVTYWMPFFGNQGVHDATWRYSFGGNIYQTRGSHGCVNAPKYVAKIIFENIEAGTPIIIYEEETPMN
jgi:Uncharacterized protein conserved in bacteria